MKAFGYTETTARDILRSSREFEALTPQEKINRVSGVSHWVELTVEVAGSGGKAFQAAQLVWNGTDMVQVATQQITWDEDNPINIIGGTASIGDFVKTEALAFEGVAVWVASVPSGGGGGSFKRVENITEVINAELIGDFKTPGATDRGTHADEVALNTAFPSPVVGDYAFVTDPGTIWIESSGSWVDTGQATSDDAGITGAWDTEISAGTNAIGSVLEGQYITVQRVGATWNAADSFPVLRG